MIVSVLEEDLLDITQCAYIPFAKLKDSTILITGATGLIGSLLIKALDYANEKYLLDLTIIAIVRNIEKAHKVLNGDSIQFIEEDIRSLKNINRNIDYIFHCAAVTSSHSMITNPVDNIETSVNGTQNILRLARNKNVKSIVYVSSMESYGVFGDDLREVTEDNLGYINLTSPRSCYSEGKRMCECICHCYYSQYMLPVKIARLSQTFGAGVRFTDNRVFAQFARSAIKKENIILHTLGNSYGNYCYTADVIKALLLILLNGEDNQCYNVSNEENTMSIKQMAEIVSVFVSENASKVIVDLSKKSEICGYAPLVKIKLRTDKLKKLGWSPTFSIRDMYIRMVRYWYENEEY